jgi:hypothetical protein
MTLCSRKLKTPDKFTDEELEKFRQDRQHNPKTGRRISEKGSVYKKLKEELEQKDKLNKNENIPPRLIVKKLKPKEPSTNLEK